MRHCFICLICGDQKKAARDSPRGFDIKRHGMGEDGGATDGVAAALDGAAAHQVHPAAEPFFEGFL
jgi:hypothetical protein